MPRSNKKKKPISYQEVPLDDQSAIAQLLNKERILMISRAIVSILLHTLCSKITLCQNLQASAKRHGINLKHGTSNPGTGDCAFEAIVQNINDRKCFTEKFGQSIDYYRITHRPRRLLRTLAELAAQQYTLHTITTSPVYLNFRQVCHHCTTSFGKTALPMTFGYAKRRDSSSHQAAW